ncbi:NitT/TauT family transport system ATP-binding protein [Planifilum fimeticola]|uniref:NitT/TauT family transport system ATP-binding protein n=1 Tax=Planifilum fimeticola TaxID=201975 RepID=A0A2T0LBC6_9BACL|nr:ATP-binding cassette domain-containing protein [Planifilum fimeticola]PRX39151.1 NitT/TauT family transport system ATP-binding protein [Planifilum fimeticola]
MRIEWSHLNKVYTSQNRPRARRIGLLDFTAAARKGITAVLGPEGSGKSTLLQLTAGLLVPDDGRITYQVTEGETVIWSKGRAAAVGTSALGSLKSRITYIPPMRRMNKSISLEKYLLYHAQLGQMPYPRRRVAELIAEWGLAAVRRVPLSAIPGEMMKRVMLVEMLLRDPLIALLDEPTAGLDQWGKRLLWRELRRLAPHRIILIATRDLRWAECADDLLLMESGSCRRLGPKKLLTANVPEGTVAAWYEMMQTFSNHRSRPRRGTFIADRREKGY